jgi:hypothetical protein
MGLFGRKQDRSGVNVTLLDGHHRLAVVGESHYQDAIWRQAGAARGAEVRCESIAILVPEPENPFDPDAIAVVLPAGKAGYLSREDAAQYLPGLRALMAKHGAPIAVRCVIIGGGYNGQQAKMLGVWLDHDPADFGIEVEARHASVRTGEAAAGVRSWQSVLPDDSVKRIAHLRKALIFGGGADRPTLHLRAPRGDAVQVPRRRPERIGGL